MDEEKEYLEFIRNRKCFSEVTWQHLRNCYDAREKKEYLSIATNAAVFVEAILKDILRVYKIRFNDKDELEPLKNSLNNIVKSGAVDSEDDRGYYSDIIRRASEIQAKRNRLVHDTGISNKGLTRDAEDMFNNFEQIIRDYLASYASRKVFEANMAKNNNLAVAPDFPVFISTINAHRFYQDEFIEGFCDRLREVGINPVRCELTEYDQRDAMGKVKRMIGTCKAFVTIGLERSHNYFSRDKEGSKDQKDATHRLYTSSWLHLESGIAIGMGLKVIVMCQKDLYSEGIFDKVWNSYVRMELKMPLSVNDKKVDIVIKELVDYKNECEAKEDNTN